jgi:cadmium resistance protein CadD (predicted permease)
MDYERRYRGRWFGAFVLIAVGVIGLVANFDLIPRELLRDAWKLWPLIPLALGIELLLRRNRYINDSTHPGE